MKPVRWTRYYLSIGFHNRLKTYRTLAGAKSGLRSLVRTGVYNDGWSRRKLSKIDLHKKLRIVKRTTEERYA